jgi:hypothetical protein
MSNQDQVRVAATVKRVWDRPRIEMVDLDAAEGAQTGPKCDKHGSLSTGPQCTQ